MTITEVHTPIFEKCYQSFYTSSSKFLYKCSSKFHTSNSWECYQIYHEFHAALIALHFSNHIGQQIQTCGLLYDICLGAI
jgi:hypothetical protein